MLLPNLQELDLSCVAISGRGARLFCDDRRRQTDRHSRRPRTSPRVRRCCCRHRLRQKSREVKRSARAGDNDGKITPSELIEPRRKAYAKLDTNGDCSLS